jgi:glycosyltransferase involved in cell wall biosynthesis
VLGFAVACEAAASRWSRGKFTSVRVGIIGHLLSFEASYRQAGVSRYTEALLRELPALAPTDTFVVFSGPARPPAERAFDARLQWVHARLSTSQPVTRIAWEQSVGLSVARRQRLDLIHAPVNVTPIVSGAPRVVTVHDLAFHLYPEQYPGAKQRYLRAMTRLSVRRATRVIAVSEATRRDVIRLYGADPQRVVTVPNGVGPEFTTLPAEVVATFRRERRLPERFALYLGTLQPRKNLETLLRAYVRVAAETGLGLVVAGAEGWGAESIYATARSLGVAEQVRFAGYVAPDELPFWYNAASMLVYPSFYEGFGLPALEAMACGTPVIAADNSALPEVVGDAGLLVGARDVDGFAHAITTLARDDHFRARLAERGRARAAGYSWRATAVQTLAVYQQAVESARHAHGPKETQR